MPFDTPPDPERSRRGGDPGGGRLPENIMHFARVLRAAGLPVGPGQVIRAVEAAEAVGIGTRDDFYWTLHAVFVNRRDQRDLFDQAFHVFWRNPRLLERLMSVILPTTEAPADEEREEMSRRLAEALKGLAEAAGQAPEQERVELDAVMTWTDREVLKSRDFEKMSQAEIDAAKRALARMRLPVERVATRRYRSDPAGPRIDMRRILRRSVRSGGDTILLARRRRKTRRPPLVVLCDISGSMSRYSRMLLHFLHAVTNDRDRVHTFLFGTRLTNVTRYLRYKDVDEALDKIGQVAEDWDGGTRIGQTLGEFNRLWSRRTLGQGAMALLITDGLDRDGGAGLEREMDRLHRSCRRLIWLNPLLRYEGFEPKSAGIRAMLPHVDDFRTVHNLESLEQLSAAFAQPGARQDRSVTRWLPMLRP
ncbi:MAG: VWA domain-containing protein [Rhodospirillaceae bacterium]|nr:VWA domain-containing protein [Rhodospirillaceae bacterium]MDE0616174.1 VWA domain-containing protein [Rhodospirillaceae bacterium]